MATVATDTVRNVAEVTDLDRALAAFVRSHIRYLREEEGLTWEECAKQLGTSHAWLIAIANPEKYGPRKVGQKLERSLANALTNGSVDDLRDAARQYAEEHVEAMQLLGGPDQPERYPARERAIKALVLLGHNEAEVRKAADAAAAVLDSETDMHPEWWADLIKVEIVRRRRGMQRFGDHLVRDEDEKAEAEEDETLAEKGTPSADVEAAQQAAPPERQKHRREGDRAQDERPRANKKASASKRP